MHDDDEVLWHGASLRTLPMPCVNVAVAFAGLDGRSRDSRLSGSGEQQTIQTVAS